MQPKSQSNDDQILRRREKLAITRELDANISLIYQPINLQKAMPNENANAANNAANNVTPQVERPAALTYENVKILSVGLYTGPDADPTKPRLNFLIDKKIKSFDNKHNEVEKNDFNLPLFQITRETLPFIVELQYAQTCALGQRINPLIVAMCLTNATITLHQEYKFAGELRSGKDEGQPDSTYENDIWKRNITKVIPNIQPIFMQGLLKKIEEEPAYIVKSATSAAMPQMPTASNPFGV